MAMAHQPQQASPLAPRGDAPSHPTSSSLSSSPARKPQGDHNSLRETIQVARRRSVPHVLSCPVLRAQIPLPPLPRLRARSPIFSLIADLPPGARNGPGRSASCTWEATWPRPRWWRRPSGRSGATTRRRGRGPRRATRTVWLRGAGC